MTAYSRLHHTPRYGQCMNSVVLFGATGYTGQLTAHALMRRGLTPTLAGRSAARLTQLQRKLIDSFDRLCPIAIADSKEPSSVRALLTSPSDVLLSTVGPFSAHGSAALNAAIQGGTAYVDSTGEPPFIRHVYLQGDAAAKQTGARLLTAFGYDYVPGNLAGLLALRQATALDARVHRVEIGYFISGPFGISSGTKASAAAMLLEPSFAYRDGRLTKEATARHVKTFLVDDEALDALSIGGSEHFCLPELNPDLRRVDVYLGWAGKHTRAAQRGSQITNLLGAIPGGSAALRQLTMKVAPTGTGPTAEDRARAVSVAVARTFDRDGNQLSHITVRGPSPYDLTAELLAWAAEQFQRGNDQRTGALKPATAFGEEAFIQGCAELGLQATT
jgi:short subunit dehydrogenase-like uncharacterized protein